MYACMHACMYVCMYIYTKVCLCLRQLQTHDRDDCASSSCICTSVVVCFNLYPGLSFSEMRLHQQDVPIAIGKSQITFFLDLHAHDCWQYPQNSC